MRQPLSHLSWSKHHCPLQGLFFDSVVFVLFEDNVFALDSIYKLFLCRMWTCCSSSLVPKQESHLIPFGPVIHLLIHSSVTFLVWSWSDQHFSLHLQLVPQVCVLNNRNYLTRQLKLQEIVVICCYYYKCLCAQASPLMKIHYNLY